MSKLQMRSEIAYKHRNNQPVPLTVTMEGSGSAVANMYADEIIVDVVDAEVDKYIELTTPMAFEVIKAYTIHEDAVQSAVAVYNGAAIVTNAIAIAAVDTDIDKVSTIDDTYSTFARGDDDLRLEVTTTALVAKVIIKIEPVVQ